MARLTIKLYGEEVSRLTLEPGMEYIAGRAADAHIPLANERGISRHHLKFYQREGEWVVESLSKFVLIQRGDQPHQVIELRESCVFLVTPYEFHFEHNSSAADKSDTHAPLENLPVVAQATPRSSMPEPEDYSDKVNNEATKPGVSSLIPYIRISFPNTADDEVLKLEGNLWVAGREQSCEIFIDSPHISRRQFELVRTMEGFYITDLGSSNGTKINGTRIPSHEPTRLESGDSIRVMNIDMSFEIRDPQFSSRMQSLPATTFDAQAAGMAPNWPAIPGSMDVTVIRQFNDMPSASEDKAILSNATRTKRIRLALIAILPLIFYFALFGKSQKPSERLPAANGDTSLTFDNLTPEKRSIIKDGFNLSRNLYVQGKYELCLTELAKVHELIQQFENSRELQSFCEQGRELVHRQRDLERKERERALIETQIAGYVETCKAKLNANAGVEETRQCLAEAVELDPEHHLIVEMVNTAQMREEEKKFMQARRKEVEDKAKIGLNRYGKAKQLYKSGKLYKALTEYEKYLSSEYPNNEGTKEQAKREIASIRKELKTKVDFYLDQCKSLGSRNRYKEAYEACDKALEEEPSNTAAKDYRGEMLSNLRREMKSIYEDSVLEESLGNVDSAKEKWQKILKENLGFDDYSTKARSKLQKYGVGM